MCIRDRIYTLLSQPLLCLVLFPLFLHSLTLVISEPLLLSLLSSPVGCSSYLLRLPQCHRLLRIPQLLVTPSENNLYSVSDFPFPLPSVSLQRPFLLLAFSLHFSHVNPPQPVTLNSHILLSLPFLKPVESLLKNCTLFATLPCFMYYLFKIFDVFYTLKILIGLLYRKLTKYKINS